MRVIINETERLAQMVEELDFSRIQSGRLTLVKTKMDILAELEEAVLIYGERAKRKTLLLFIMRRRCCQLFSEIKTACARCLLIL